MTWKELKIGECFKNEQDHVTFFKKIKLGRKHVYINMIGGFTFLPPCGMPAKTIVFPCDENGNLL